MAITKTNPVAHQLAINLAGGAEVSFTFPQGTTAFSIISRTGVNYRVGFRAGDVTAGDYFLKTGSTEWYEDCVMLMNNRRFWFTSDTAGGHNLDILTWQ